MITSNFHNTRLLLRLYPQINWRIKTELDEINEEKNQYSIKDVEVFINILETTDLIENKILENLTDILQ